MTAINCPGSARRHCGPWERVGEKRGRADDAPPELHLHRGMLFVILLRQLPRSEACCRGGRADRGRSASRFAPSRGAAAHAELAPGRVAGRCAAFGSRCEGAAPPQRLAAAIDRDRTSRHRAPIPHPTFLGGASLPPSIGLLRRGASTPAIRAGYTVGAEPPRFGLPPPVAGPQG